LFFIPTKNLGQCAGNDANLEVCNIPDASSQAIALYPLLGAGATPGGKWTDDFLSGGLNVTTGILNVQVIPKSGVYKYTYTVSGVSGCVDTSSTVTVVVGGYSGVTGPNASVCSDENAFNLFQVFNGSYLSPQSNGSWFNNSTNTAVNSVIDAATLGLGTFQFTYSIPAIGTCPAVSSTAFVSVFRAPIPGLSSRLLLCDSDDLSQYSNLDLNNQLAGEDAGGTWSDNNGTGQITFLNDHFIDVKNIYNTFGVGEYTFTYTVLPSNPICNKKSTTVRIKIEKRLDFTGATLVVNSDICESEIPTATYSAVLKKGSAVIPNGQYYVTYNVSGPAGETKTELLTFNNGVLNFSLDSKYFQKVGDFLVTITDITAFGSEGACHNIINNLFDVLHVYPIPILDGAKLTINPVCQNKSALVQITGATLLADGTYDIVYNLTGTNTVTPQTTQIVVVGGVSNFTIPSSFISNSGNTAVTITKITNVITKCTNSANVSGTMLVNPLPNPTNFKIVVDDYCLNNPVSVALSGLGALANITITYTLSGANVATQTTTLAVSGGNVNFIIPSNLLTNTGSNTITVTNLINNETTCDIIISTVSDNFLINPVPNAPIAISFQKFCKADVATITNLVPTGSQYQWFDSATATTPLSNSFVLVSGNYYVKEMAATSLCLSQSTMVSVTINPIPTSPTTTTQQEFCKVDQATVANLTPNGSQYKWYNSATATTPLASSTLLVSANYYLRAIDLTTLCQSTSTVVTVKINDLPAPILNQDIQSFCGINEPKISDLVVNATVPNSIVWYDAPSNGNLLNGSALLKDKAIYYGFDTTTVTDCIPKNNFAVTVSLTDCTTSQYDFFIPDGFSPTGDGVNDYFTIPKIEFLYPDFTLEIYNRYGNMMFKGNKNKPNWDGRNSESAGFSDAIAPNGVYFYIVNFNKDKKSPQQGRLYLNR
jgi:gliding motility-associated-like protein